jgi:putative transferase (TIGR04331 family)
MATTFHLTKSSPLHIPSTPFLDLTGEADAAKRLVLGEHTKRDFLELVEKADLLLDEMIPRLTAFYTTTLGLQITAREAEFLVYRPLTFLVRQFLGSYYFLAQADLQQVEFITLAEEDFLAPNSDNQMTDALKNSDFFSLQIFTTILEARGIATRRLRHQDFVDASNHSRKKIHKDERTSQLLYSYAALKAHFSRTQEKASSHPVQFIKGGLHGSVAHVEMGRMAVPLFNGIFLFRTDTALRGLLKQALQRPGDDTLVQAFAATLSACIPRTYVEGMRYYMRMAKQQMARYKRTFTLPAYVVADRFFYTHERFFVREMMGEGVKLCVVQHGSVYGESKMAIWERSEARMADLFLTWGWRKQENQLPYHAVKLASLQKRPAPTEGQLKDLLWLTRGSIGNSGWEYLLFFDYDRVQEQFYLRLHEPLRQHIVLRLLTTRFTKKDNVSIWRYRYPGIRVDYMEGKLVDKLKTARMAVIDYFFSTAFPECILTDTPVIVFEENKTPAFSDLAKPVYDQLAAVGVVHFSYLSAADFINTNLDRIDVWWQSAPVREAINAYKFLFAREASAAGDIDIHFKTNTGKTL